MNDTLTLARNNSYIHWRQPSVNASLSAQVVGLNHFTTPVPTFQLNWKARRTVSLPPSKEEREGVVGGESTPLKATVVRNNLTVTFQ